MGLVHAGLRVGLALLPVLTFLLVLVLMDSYKLVRPRRVAWMLVAGAAAAIVSLGLNVVLLEIADVAPTAVARYLAPLVEEILKGAAVTWVVARRRVGFLVDAAILGFAVGAGFAALENLHYLVTLSQPSLLLWGVRGFGTAVMHGSVTAIMAILSKQLADTHGVDRPWVYLPGLAIATVLHSAFNHFVLSPSMTTVLMLVLLPVFFVAVFTFSERRTREWLGVGFDTDAELLRTIQAGQLGSSRIGQYLHELRSRFPAETVADMLCLLRLRLELSIKAKGILMAREAGFDLPPDPELDAHFAELRYLEHTIGSTGLLALKPVFHFSDRDLWQHHLLTQR